MLFFKPYWFFCESFDYFVSPFHADFKDYIICFKCALGLFNLTPGDDPALEHARLEPFCLHFRLVTGNTLIREAQRDMIVTGQ